MANRFMSSADHYNNTYINSKWTTSLNASIASAFGEFGEAALSIGASGWVQRTIDPQVTWICGWRTKITNSLPASNTVLLAMLDGSTTQMDIRLLTDGTLQVTRNGTILGTTTYSIFAGNTFHIEYKVTVNNSTGTAVVRVDGDTKLTLTNVDTQFTSNAYANSFRWNGNTNLYAWDFYINDGTGSFNNDFLGPVRIIPHYPNNPGDSNQWLNEGGVASANNYQSVDNVPPLTTAYVESDTPGQLDLYNIEALKVSGTIKAVQHGTLARTTGGATNIQQVIKPSSTEFNSASIALPGTFVYQLQQHDTNPDTLAAWTEAEFNATQVGQEKV